MKSIFIFAILLSLTRAWWGTGHLLVARIAQYHLENQDPETLKAAIDILSVLTKTGDEYNLTKERDHPFVECATYMDALYKQPDGLFEFHWHFVDTPFLDQGGKLSDFDFQPSAYNVTQSLKHLSAWFKKEEGYKDSHYYKMIMNATWSDHSEANGMSTAMRFIIHSVGDIHQPLHSASRVDENYPKGDMGGNAFPVLEKGQEDFNLHSVWDSVFLEFPGYGDIPFNQSSWDTISKQAAELMNQYRYTEYRTEELDP